MLDQMPQPLKDAYAERVPMRRGAQPDEIAAMIAFLATEDASLDGELLDEILNRKEYFGFSFSAHQISLTQRMR